MISGIWDCFVSIVKIVIILMNFCNFRDHTGVNRYLIQRQGRFFMLGGRKFHSIEEIISRYKQEQLAENVSLGEPINKSDYELSFMPLRGQERADSVDGYKPDFPRLNSRASDRYRKSTKNGYLLKKSKLLIKCIRSTRHASHIQCIYYFWSARKIICNTAEPPYLSLPPKLC